MLGVSWPLENFSKPFMSVLSFIQTGTVRNGDYPHFTDGEAGSARWTESQSCPALGGPGQGAGGCGHQLEDPGGLGPPSLPWRLQQLLGIEMACVPRPPGWPVTTCSCHLLSEPAKTQKYSCPSMQTGHQIWKWPSGGPISLLREGDSGLSGGLCC